MESTLAPAAPAQAVTAIGEAQQSEPSRPSSYDDMPYSVGAFPQTSPDRLATIATLFGMKPAFPARCRVLELGCASGGNLIPMALAAPGSRFVGIDLSARQIADGRAVVGELDLPNIELRHASIMDVGEELGEFDYILAHGVYSWVPPEVQARILKICNSNLVEQGVAYISYNCYPGWHARGAIREMLWYHTRRFDDPMQRVRAARGLLALLAKSAMAAGDGGYGSLMRHELAVLLSTPDTYLLHEHLEEFNEPLYFHQFAQRAAEEGLQYLGEAQIAAMVPTRLGAEVESTLRRISPDLLHMEQYMDFLRNRMFRQTLLCHAEVSLKHALDPQAVPSFHVASDAQAVTAGVDIQSDAPAEYKAQGAITLSTRDPMMKAVMACLTECWPAAMRFDELFAAARSRLGESGDSQDANQRLQIATRLLNCYTSGIVDLSLTPSPFVARVTERPVASPYARLRAREGEKVTNMKLQSLMLGEPARAVLAELDGTHDREAIIGKMAAWLQAKAAQTPAATGQTMEATLKVATDYVDKVLPQFARAALLIR